MYFLCSVGQNDLLKISHRLSKESLYGERRVLYIYYIYTPVYISQIYHAERITYISRHHEAHYSNTIIVGYVHIFYLLLIKYNNIIKYNII